MSGNTIGKLFCVTTFGESHGNALGCIVDGVPPGINISEDYLQNSLNKRRPGKSIYVTNRTEKDKVNILSGVFNGRTTGTPIGLLIKNNDHKSNDYEKIKNIFRPGHADFTYQKKYGIRDYRGGGRASGRETSMRVAAGAIAKKFLYEALGVNIYSYLSRIGNICCDSVDLNFIEKNPFLFPDKNKINFLHELFISLKKSGDSVGSKVTIIANNVPIGLGEPVFDKLDADIAHSMMSIGAAKSVEIGDGINVSETIGSKNLDELTKNGFLSNHAGGILGGISTGQPIIVHVSFKPTPSILIPSKTIDCNGSETKIVTSGRHDICIGIRAAPVAESMLAITLCDHFLRNRGQCG